MRTLQVAHTADIEPVTLVAAHDLLRDVFEGDLTDHDWEHSLGGMHALAWDDGELVGHAAVVMRRLLHDGRVLRTGYMEGVGVRADRRRHGHAAVMMGALERIIRGAYDVGALGATGAAMPLYAGRGWLPWRGETWASTPDGVVRTADEDGSVFVYPGAAPLDLDGRLTCDWREGDGW
ncbi:MAG: GNAT family N-acetyltransferase [Marmoricola sp.]